MSFNLIESIPKHRLLKIIGKNESGDKIDACGAPLILDDDFSIKASSKYGALWEGQSSNLMSLLSSSFGIPSGQFALQGMQIWQGTDPLTFSIKANLYMDSDPLKDVVKPAIALMQTCLPTKDKEMTPKKVLGKAGDALEKTAETFGDKANFFTEILNLKLSTLIPPGPNLQGIWQAMRSAGGSDKNPLKGAKGLYEVYFGIFHFMNVIIKSVEPTFSKTVAESIDGKKYPASAELSIEMSTAEVATTDMVISMI